MLWIAIPALVLMMATVAYWLSLDDDEPYPAELPDAMNEHPITWD